MRGLFLFLRQFQIKSFVLTCIVWRFRNHDQTHIRIRELPIA